MLAACSGPASPQTGGSTLSAGAAPSATAPATTDAPTPNRDDTTARPSSDRLAYVDRPFDQSGEATSRLILTDVTGATSEVVTEGALGGVVWSPSGDRIAYVARETDTGSSSDEGAPVEALRIVELASGEVTTVVEGNVTEASWAPDGRRLVLGVSEPGTDDGSALAVADLDTGTTTVITRPDGNSDHVTPAWSPTGDRIAYVRSTHPSTASGPAGDRTLVTVAPDGRDVREPAPDLHLVGPPAWSADGRTLAVRASEHRDERAAAFVALVDTHGGDTPTLDVADPHGEVAFSPSGDRLAIVAGPQPDESDIHVLRVDDGTTVTVLDGDAFDAAPSWTADGTRIAFIAATGFEGSVEIAIGNVGTGQVTTVTSDGSVESPAFAPR